MTDGKVPLATIVQNGGSALFSKQYSSVQELLMTVFPEIPWDPTKFRRHSRNHWTDIANQRQFLLELGPKLGFQSGDMESWYNLSVEDLAKHGGWRLLMAYSGSPANVLKTVFPEHKWLPWKFGSNKNRLRDVDLKELVSFLQEEFKIVDEGHWYRITLDQLNELGLKNVVKDMGGLRKILEHTYPDRPWREDFFLA
jgi:hypothetical protein